MVIYGLDNCDSTRAALKLARQKNLVPTYFDVRKEGLKLSVLERWERKVGWETLLNTRSTTWRELPLMRKSDLNKKKALQLIADHPTLLKRPLLEHGAEVFVGHQVIELINRS